MKQKLLLKSMLLLFALIAGSSSVWAASLTTSGSWDLTSTSSDWTSSNCETYFSQPYGMKKANAYIMNKAIGDFSTENITSIKIGVKCLQNGGTTSRLTVYLVNSSGNTVGSGQVITPTNASAASNTAYSYATFNSGFTGVTGFKVQCTTFGKNVLINGASYDVTYTAPDVPVTGVSLPSTANVKKGKTITLTPSFTPSTATNKSVTWVSKNTSVATVSDAGVVTGAEFGTAEIEVTTADGGFKATCEVTVDDGTVNLSSPISITSWPSLSYGAASEYEVEGIYFTATQCMKNTGLQFKSSTGKLASPTIKSTYGYTVFVTTNSSGTGTLTLQIGSETPVSVKSGESETYSATTSNTSVAFTLTNSSGNACNIASIVIAPNQYSTTVQSYGWATFIAPAPVEFAANTAYVVTDASISGTTGSLTMEAVTQVPKDTPVLLKGEGSKDITVIASAAAPATNLLSIGTGTTPAGKYPYVLAKDGEGACFKQWTGTAATLNGRVVLLLDESIATAPVFTLDTNETTGINAVNGSEFKVNGEYYNLAGQRVANPTKGLYIVNGKKVIIK